MIRKHSQQPTVIPAKAGIQGFRALVDPSGGVVEQGYFTYRSGATAAEQLLSRRQRPTTIFAANDDMAAATLATAHRMGIDVPRELSIAGFDDTPIAATLWPTLTTVRQPIAAMARTAVQSLPKEMRRQHDKNPRPPSQQLLRHVLVKRGSTGSVPTAAWSGRAHGSAQPARSPVLDES